MCHSWNRPNATRAARALLLLAGLSPRLVAQSADPLARERAEYLAWLRTAPNSPLAAIAQQPLRGGLRLGPPGADLPLDGLPEHSIREADGRITLRGPEGVRDVPHGRPTRLGGYALTVGGPAGGAVVTVFGPPRGKSSVQYYPLNESLIFSGPLIPPEQRGTVRVLGADGIEVEAIEAGSVLLPLDEKPTRLRVRRIPTGGEESELEIYFRDATNGAGTYPAGRFVVLIPKGDGTYRLDFNRARNPFCAYSSAYPCPAPWRENSVAAAIRAGERYGGKGPEAVPPAR